MKFGLSEKNNNNNNNNNEKNQKLAEEINKLIPQEMQQQIIKAIAEYKSGDLVLFMGEHVFQCSIFDYIANIELLVETNSDFHSWRLFAGFSKILFKDYYEANIQVDEPLPDNNEGNEGSSGIGITYSRGIGQKGPIIDKDYGYSSGDENKVIYIRTITVRAEYVPVFLERWNKFYSNGSFDNAYFEQLTSSLQTNPSSSMTP